MSNIANCAVKSASGQVMEIGKLMIRCTKDGNPDLNGSVTQSIISEVMAKCVQDNQQVNDATNKIDNIIDEKLKASNSGIFSTGTIMMIAIIALIVLGGGAIFTYFRSSGLTNFTMPQYQQPQYQILQYQQPQYQQQQPQYQQPYQQYQQPYQQQHLS